MWRPRLHAHQVRVRSLRELLQLLRECERLGQPLVAARWVEQWRPTVAVLHRPLRRLEFRVLRLLDTGEALPQALGVLEKVSVPHLREQLVAPLH